MPELTELEQAEFDRRRKKDGTKLSKREQLRLDASLSLKAFKKDKMENAWPYMDIAPVEQAESTCGTIASIIESVDDHGIIETQALILKLGLYFKKNWRKFNMVEFEEACRRDDG